MQAWMFDMEILTNSALLPLILGICAALLVGLLPSPNGNDPCSNPQAALKARNGVLLKMADTGRISADRARQARRQPVQLGGQRLPGRPHWHFLGGY